MRERNQFSAVPKQTVDGRSKQSPMSLVFGCLDEHVFTNDLTDELTDDFAQIFALTSTNRFQALLPEQDFRKAPVSNDSGKSGKNPIGFSNWGKKVQAESKTKEQRLNEYNMEIVRTRAQMGVPRNEIIALYKTLTAEPERSNRFARNKTPRKEDVMAALRNKQARRTAKIKLYKKWHGTNSSRLVYKRTLSAGRRLLKTRQFVQYSRLT